MSLVLIAYLIPVLDALGQLLLVLAFAATALIIVFNVVCLIEDSGIKLVPSKWLCLSVTMVLVGLLLPSEDTSYKMLAAYGIEETINSDKVRSIADKASTVVEIKLDQFIKENTPNE